MAIVDFVATSPHCGVKEIARGLKLSTPTVSVSVRQLEEAGFLERQPHPTDRRAVQLFLTPAGQTLHEQTYAFRRQTFERLLSGLTPEEREMLLALLEKALDKTDAHTHSHKGDNS
jgi:DNA-binding MarR family transcriptional regulator